MYNVELKPRHRQFLNTELDKMFEALAQKPTEDVFAPACEILDEEALVTLSLDIPGMQKEDISIEMKDNQLFVSGERKFIGKTEKNTVLRSERRYGKFSRVFKLPPNINPEGTQAKFENGVLSITLKKEEKLLSRKISITN